MRRRDSCATAAVAAILAIAVLDTPRAYG